MPASSRAAQFSGRLPCDQAPPDNSRPVVGLGAPSTSAGTVRRRFVAAVNRVRWRAATDESMRHPPSAPTRGLPRGRCGIRGHSRAQHRTCTAPAVMVARNCRACSGSMAVLPPACGGGAHPAHNCATVFRRPWQRRADARDTRCRQCAHR